MNSRVVVEPLRDWINTVAGFFYPNVCQICLDEPAGADEGYVGRRCRTRPGAIRPIVPPFCDRCGLPFPGDITTSFQCSNCFGRRFDFISARAAVAAKGLVLEVIHQFKYHRALWFEPFLAELLLERAVPNLHGGGWDLIVPIPLHPLKKREREFNQAERLARRLADALSLPLDCRLLCRAVATATQTHLSRAERMANVAQAFRIHSGRALQGERIVLVDDVFTTGATSQACAKMLRRNGSGEVCVWTVARGL